MQIHTHSKCKVIRVYFGWHHTMGHPLYEMSLKHHYTFSLNSTICKSGWIFHFFLLHPPHFDIIFDPQAITAHSAIVHRSGTLYIVTARSTDMNGVQRVGYDDPAPLTLDHLNSKSMKKALREMQTLRTGCSKAEPKISPRRRPLSRGCRTAKI